jgi:hypothetical protein
MLLLEISPGRNFLIGIALAVVFFCIAIIISHEQTFLRDDNLSHDAPLIVDAARQAKAGKLPLRTYYVGGGGGFPLVTPLQPGVLNPFTLIPAMLLLDNPERMMNVIVAIHAGILAAGSWFLACALRAPLWPRLIAAVSLSSCGFFWIWTGNWASLGLPYSFLPWLLGSMVSFCRTSEKAAGSIRYQVLAIAAFLFLLFSGLPTAIFYGGIASAFCITAVLIEEKASFKIFCIRLVPLCIVVVVVAGPLVWEALQVLSYYARRRHVNEWISLTVPLKAYLGLLIPGTHSQWFVGWVGHLYLSNVLLSCGIVPVWLGLYWLVRRPAWLLKRPVQVLFAGIIVFVLIMSPGPFNLAPVFAKIPILNGFRWPFRAIPAFHMLVVVLFLTLATRDVEKSVRSMMWPLALVCTLFLGFGGLVYESRVESKNPAASWYDVTPKLDDKESWSEATLTAMRKDGCVMSFSRPYSYWKKPRLFLLGNLVNWERGKRFLDLSSKEPVPSHDPWENGTGPKDLYDFADWTYVGAVIVENSWSEPLEYFTSSQEWEMLEQRKDATAFQRRQAPTKKRSHDSRNVTIHLFGAVD